MQLKVILIQAQAQVQALVINNIDKFASISSKLFLILYVYEKLYINSN